uniref:SFRICE_027032 n=1 Tax=Spodoptera frugiperda TaxID=7108 RepID=A0A2H1W620_SPOFR
MKFIVCVFLFLAILEGIQSAPTFCLIFNCYRPSYSTSQSSVIYQNTYTNTGHHNVMIVNGGGTYPSG